MRFSHHHLHPLDAIVGYDIVVTRPAAREAGDVSFQRPVIEVVEVIDGAGRYAEAWARSRELIAAGGIYGARPESRFSCGCRFAALSVSVGVAGVPA